jgi:hypothetical protein
LTAEGTTSKGTGSISCEVEFCIFYRLSLRTLRTKDVLTINECVYLAVFIQVAKRTSRIILPSVLCLPLPHFSYVIT